MLSIVYYRILLLLVCLLFDKHEVASLLPGLHIGAKAASTWKRHGLGLQ